MHSVVDLNSFIVALFSVLDFKAYRLFTPKSFDCYAEVLSVGSGTLTVTFVDTVKHNK